MTTLSQQVANIITIIIIVIILIVALFIIIVWNLKNQSKKRPSGEQIMINFTIFFVILYNHHHRHQPLQHDIQYHVHRHRYAFLITAL